jgi:hypothetical protein
MVRRLLIAAGIDVDNDDPSRDHIHTIVRTPWERRQEGSAAGIAGPPICSTFFPNPFDPLAAAL